MQISYIAKTTINFVDFEFYIRPGDLLVHDTSNHNRLTIYRNGQIAKVGTIGSLGIVAFIRNHFIEEVTTAPVEARPSPVYSEVSTPPIEVRKVVSKRDKAHPQEVPVEEYQARVTVEDKAE